MLNNEINEDFVHTQDEMPEVDESSAKEWIISNENRVKGLMNRATEWVKANPKTVVGALLGVGAVCGGIVFFARSRRHSALAEFAAAMKRFH